MSRFSLGEFFLKERKGIWQICWYDRATRQTKHTSTGLRDFEEAKVRLAEHVVRHGSLAGARAEDVPVVAVLDRYYEGHAKALPSGEYARYALGFWRKHWQGVVSDITAASADAFVSALVEAGLSPGSVNRVLGVGRAALARAHKRGEIDRLPFIPSVKVPAPKMARATPDDIAAILNACNGELDHVRRWLLISMGTLARPEAVLELTREQCDFALGRIDLCQLGRPQSRKVRPVVPMVRSIRGLLEASPPGLLVTYRGEPLADIRMGFERARARAGVPKHITPYTIRRTLASELRRRGVPPWEIAGFLGHSARDYRTTEVYAEFSPDYLGAASSAIDAYFEELAPLLDFEIPEGTHAEQDADRNHSEGQGRRATPAGAGRAPTVQAVAGEAQHVHDAGRSDARRASEPEIARATPVASRVSAGSYHIDLSAVKGAASHQPDTMSRWGSTTELRASSYKINKIRTGDVELDQSKINELPLAALQLRDSLRDTKK